MDNWNLVKKESQANECYEVKSEYCDPLDSYFTFDFEQSCDIKIENGEFPKVGKESSDIWKAESSHYPESMVEFGPLEYSKNQKTQKYLKSLMPTIASSAEFSSEETIMTELNQNVKMESVELKTLNENTLMRSSLETCYASPWDFVEISEKCGQINSTTQQSKKKQRHHATNSKLPRDTSNKVDEPNSIPSQTARMKIDKIVKNFTCRYDASAEQTRLNENFSIAHDKKKLWKCEICGRKFKERKNLYQHMQTHSQKKYKCDKCPKSYSYTSTLRRHAQIHDEGNKEKNIPKSSVHRDHSIRAKKPKMDEKVATETPDKLYKCDICHQRFEKKSVMRVHIEFLHIELFRQQPEKPYRTPKRKTFNCQTCDKRYTQASHLYRHEATHLAEKAYYCEECNIRFGRRSTLSRHMLHKHNEKYLRSSNELRKKVEPVTSFVCRICGKSFITHYDLRRHCATHDARKPYECDICKKQFALKSYLYAHVLTHDNWKPYPCDKCPKFYRRKSSLQRHIEVSHLGKTTTTCHICRKTYKHLASYNAHMKNHH